jgi:signal transduction histidine kinase
MNSFRSSISPNNRPGPEYRPGSGYRPGWWPWLRERLFPRGTNLIQWAAYLIIIAMLISYALQASGVPPFQYNSTLLALTILLVITIVWDDLVSRFPNPQAGEWTLLLISAVLTFYTIIVGWYFNSIYILFMIAARANATVRPLPALGFSVLLFGAYLGLSFAIDLNPGHMLEFSVSILIGITFTITLSQVLRLYIEQSEKMTLLLAQIQQANTELVAAREKEKELTIAEERVRMARDLHDGLGHHLTALSIQLQAAEKLVRANPDQAAESVHNARGEVQAALKEVRQSVAALRESPVDIQHLPQAIAALVAETGQRSGLQGSFTQEGEPADLSPAAAMTLFRAAQEGLTNVQKHAAGAHQVSVRLVYAASGTRLAVENDGQQVTQDCQDLSGGFGLAGLRERAHLLGGSLECGPRQDGGFRVEIYLPAEFYPGQPA